MWPAARSPGDLMNPRITAIAQTLTMLLASSFVGVLAKLALRDVPPFTFVWLQIAIGGSLLTLYTFQLRGERIPKGLGRQVWASIIWIGVANFTIVRALFMLSLDRLPATTHAYLVNFVGIATMLMSILILQERPSIFQLLGAGLAVCGLRVFFREIPPPSEVIGVIYVAIAVLALASTNNIARKLGTVTRDGLSNNIISTIALWIGGLPVVLAGLRIDWPPPVAGWKNWGIILLNAIVTIAIGLTVWNYILRTLRSYEASMLAASGVIYTAILAVAILGERLALHQIVGIAMMLVGLSLVQVRRGILQGRPTTKTTPG
jgi:drug/metabolite transporter (DMT)-like permease